MKFIALDFTAYIALFSIQYLSVIRAINCSPSLSFCSGGIISIATSSNNSEGGYKYNLNWCLFVQDLVRMTYNVWILCKRHLRQATSIIAGPL